jgi:hypothetical protein
MSNEDQPRNERGEWTSGSAEQQTRNAGRYPVAPHGGANNKSVGTHSSKGTDFGKLIYALMGAGLGVGGEIIKKAQRDMQRSGGR